MSFRTFFIINRIVAPAWFALLAATWAMPSGPIVSGLRLIAGAAFTVVCVFGAYQGLKFQYQQFMSMRCPFCGSEGLVGRGVTSAVGWWLSCDQCGIVTPQDWFGFRYKRTPVDEYGDSD